MSYNNPRLTGDMTGLQALQVMGGHNPGAISVLVKISHEAERIDPDDAFGYLGVLMGLDTLGIYEHNIWGLYKDICGQDLVSMLGVLRAWQLGILPEAELKAVMQAERTPDAGWLPNLLAKVRERLPRFGKV